MFEVSADAYARFMGRFSRPLGELFLAEVDLRRGQRVLDVGCGSGVLTAALVDRLGEASVAAVDPSSSFVATVREQFPDVDVRLASAEDLPFDDASFDAVLAQLVVHFMNDPIGGIAEMARTAVPGGTVAASVWDHADDKGPLSAFWAAVKTIDPTAQDESNLRGVRDGQLAEMFRQAGLRDVTASSLTVRVHHQTFDEWWDPFTLGVGPAGAYVASLDDAARDRLRQTCYDQMPQAPFDTMATAWTAFAVK